jgi:Putative NADH-flavin reductase
VTAVTRHPHDFPLRHDGLTVFSGDVYDADSVDQAVAGQHVVISALGVPYSRKPVSVYSTGIRNILYAMAAHGVERIACVSSSATDPQVRRRDTGGGYFFEKVLKPVIGGTFGRTLYADMLRMERMLRASDTEWTIVRPSGLFETETVTDYLVSEDFVPARFTSRADLADFLLRQATDRTFVRKAAALATVSDQPTVWQLLRNEALQGASKG